MYITTEQNIWANNTWNYFVGCVKNFQMMYSNAIYELFSALYIAAKFKWRKRKRETFDNFI